MDFEQPFNTSIVIEDGFEGHSSFQLSVSIIDDQIIEGDEDFFLVLSPGNDFGVVIFMIGPLVPVIRITIEDDDSCERYSQAATTVCNQQMLQ